MYGQHTGRLTVYTTSSSVERPLLDEAEDHGFGWFRAELNTVIEPGDQVNTIHKYQSCNSGIMCMHCVARFKHIL